ncbi:hypothetical protein BAE44_0020238, partial [Dichanthelium oligosanthes]
LPTLRSGSTLTFLVHPNITHLSDYC